MENSQQKQQQQQQLDQLRGECDNYNVFHIKESDLLGYRGQENRLEQLIKNTVQNQKQLGRKAIWFNIHQDSIYLSQYALQNGFKLHHSEKESVMFYNWLKEESPCNLPQYATHVIGAAGLIINNKNQILFVQEKSGFRKDKWNIPMGRVDDGELLHQAAIREVKEETGLDTDCADLILIREQDQGTFGKVDLFFTFLLKMKDDSQEVKIDEGEVKGYRWIGLQELSGMLENEKDKFAFPTQIKLLKYVDGLYQSGFKFYKDKLYDFSSVQHNNKLYNYFLTQQSFL